MKRVVYEKIGGLDERFGLGFFDDDDLAERARRAGFNLAVAQDLFVHHFGSRTFQGNGVDAGKLLDENARRFEAKWGLKEAKGKPVALRPWSGGIGSHAKVDGDAEGLQEEDLTQSRKAAKENSGGLAPQFDDEIQARSSNGGSFVRHGVSEPALASSFAALRLDVRSSPAIDGSGRTGPREGATVSLTMIVRNEEDQLAKCLGSVRGLFEEIIIVDTGSTDRTKEIAREFGAKVFDFVWIDDFAAARNEALSHATGDYAFWLDADDVVEPAEREKLRVLFGGQERASRAIPDGEYKVTGGAAPHPPCGRPLPGRGDDDCPGDANRKCAGPPAPARVSWNAAWLFRRHVTRSCASSMR